jgi:hypothetical protein
MAAGNADSNRLGPLSRFKFSAKYHNDAAVFAFNEFGICAELPTSNGQLSPLAIRLSP